MRASSILFAITFGASCAAACGGSTNNNGGGDASTGTSSGSGASSGSSSGSGSTSSSSSGGGDDATAGDDGGIACEDTSSCSDGQVCCASISIGGAAGFGFSVACAASCPETGFQLCATSAECPSGESCTPSPLGMGSYCAAPFDASAFPRRDGGFPFGDAGGPTTDGGPSPSEDAASSTDAAADGSP